jgi:hypothetical protein
MKAHPKQPAAQVRCPVHSETPCDCAVTYRLYSEVMTLPSYGLIANDPDNPMLSRKAVLKLLEREEKQPEIGKGFC